MSGGYFDHKNDTLCCEMYKWLVSPNYGDRGFSQSVRARRVNPFEDIIISELIFDVFCVIHSYDWYRSGDTDEETYRADVSRFKEKWLKQLSEERIREIIDDELNVARERLCGAFFGNGGEKS